MDIPKSTYSFTNVNYALEQILAFNENQRIDTNLDCQRGYVWTTEQKQSLIDTLINRERIPEFHVIKEAQESVFHFADGKQRITTILKFLKNELKWEKSNANPKFLELFGKSHSLSFSELPETFQNMILNTQISFAIYSDMTPASITKLFRKLNSGTALDQFQKGLAENILIKKNFLDELMKHPVIPKIFSYSDIEKGKAEQSLIRVMVLMSKLDKKQSIKCSLTPLELPKYYLDLEKSSSKEIEDWLENLFMYKNKITFYLDWLNENSGVDTLRIKSNYVFLFSLFFAHKDHLDKDTFKALYSELRKIPASVIVGPGADYSASKVDTYIKYISNILG